MNAEAQIELLQRQLQAMSQELDRARTDIKKMHMHLFPQDATGSGSGGITATITGNGATVGKYTGTATDATGASLTVSAIWNEPEIALAPAANLLKTSESYTGWYDSSTQIVHISALPVGRQTGATGVGSAAEGSEAANSTTWIRSTDASAVTAYVVSRVGFFESGDKKLYGYIRALNFDSCGLLISVSAETRYIIDTPETC